MRLSRLALPTEAPKELVENAVRNFSCSITVNTQAGYATGARAYIDAEKALGRPFSFPPTEQEMVFLVSFLINKGLEPATIKSYLSGIRFYLLSMGATNPPVLPPLAGQLLSGYEKSKFNPTLLATKKTRRPITVEMLKLLEHAIATQTRWSDYEKSLRWSVVLVAWWGSFRIGELLSANTRTFNPANALLLSDVTIHFESISLWLRNPKVNRESLGDIVEIWQIPSKPDLDPVLALKGKLASDWTI